MRLSIKKLSKLRSGQTVWRVLALATRRRVDGDISIVVTVSRVTFTGKRVAVDLSAGGVTYFATAIIWGGIRISASSCWSSRRKNDTDYLFVQDALGHGAFTSKRQAEVFAQEIRDGLHPELVERVREDHEFDECIYSCL